MNKNKAVTITALFNTHWILTFKIIMNVDVSYGNNVHRNSSATNTYQ